MPWCHLGWRINKTNHACLTWSRPIIEYIIGLLSLHCYCQWILILASFTEWKWTTNLAMQSTLAISTVGCRQINLYSRYHGHGHGHGMFILATHPITVTVTVKDYLFICWQIKKSLPHASDTTVPLISVRGFLRTRYSCSHWSHHRVTESAQPTVG